MHRLLIQSTLTNLHFELNWIKLWEWISSYAFTKIPKDYFILQNLIKFK